MLEDWKGPEAREWDEDRWEAFLREAEAETDRYMALFEKYQNHPDRDELVAREMGWWHFTRQCPYLDKEKDCPVCDQRFTCDIYQQFGFYGEIEEEDFRDLIQPEVSEGLEEPWRTTPAFQAADEFCQEIQRVFQDQELGDPIDRAYLKLFAHAGRIGVELAGASRAGFELAAVGSNMASCQRALRHAQACLEALEEMGARKLLPTPTVHRLLNLAVETRNASALWVRELRDKPW